MTMYALQRRAKDCGITVSSLHPGVVRLINLMHVGLINALTYRICLYYNITIYILYISCHAPIGV